MLGEHLDSWTSGTFQVGLKKESAAACVTKLHSMRGLFHADHRIFFDCDTLQLNNIVSI